MKLYSLHTHSDYSNIRQLDSVCKIDTLLEAAISLELSGMALTDHDTVAGHFKFLKKVKELNKKGKELGEKEPYNKKAEIMRNFKPILGNEVYLTREGLTKETFEKGERFHHLLLLAKDKIGWEQINELTSISWDRMFIRNVTRTPLYISDLEKIIGKNPGHVVCTTACLGNYLGDRIVDFGFSTGEQREELKFEILNHIETLKNIFHEDFYLEIQPGQSKQQINYNTGVIAFSKFTNVEIVATMDVHYPTADWKSIHHAYLNSQEGKERETEGFYDYTYLMNFKELNDLFGTHLNKEDYIRAIENTATIADKVEVFEISQKPIVPRIPFEDEDKWNLILHKYDEYEWFNTFSHSCEDDKFLLYQIIKGLEDKLGKGWIELKPTLERIDIELAQIYKLSEKMNQRLATYFTTMQGIIDKIWNYSVIGAGRGSAGAFMINFILDIVQINPLTAPVDLPYWRFLSEEKVNLPDIDIDSSASKRQDVLEGIREWLAGFNSTMTNIATVGTEKSKSALITAARGCGLEPEEGLYFASLVPSERGFLWDLQDCYHGNEDKGRNPSREFVEAMDMHPWVWEVAQKIEGLICRRGIHAAGIAIFNENEIYSQTAIMRAPSGAITTQFTLDDLEECGVIKYDLLSTNAIDSIQAELYLLAEYGYIDWQENLKETYNKYLHPQVIEYEDIEMWRKVHNKEVLNLFQFGDSPIGEQAIELIRPTGLLELSTINSVMRLMAAEGHEMPLVQYKRRKENPHIWHLEMSHAGLEKIEVELLEEHLEETLGMCVTQEQLMVMLQDERISGFSYIESDYARKIVAKKKMKEIEKLKDQFYESCKKQGTSQNLTDYVWYNCFAIQMGYSFSIVHTLSYSIIALQEMNLVHFYPSIFWATARLMVESGSMNFMEEDLELLLEMDDEEHEETETKNQTVDYFKMSSAIGKMKDFGITIYPPHINESSFTFKTSVEENAIYFGLKGVTRIGDNVIRDIIANRPYKNVEDLLKKVNLNKIQITMLIKAGAFDFLGDRQKILYDYCDMVADKKQRLTLQNAQRIIELDLVPEELEQYSKLFKLNKHLKKYYKYGDRLLPDDNMWTYIEMFDFKDYEYEDNEAYLDLKKWENYYKKSMVHLKNWINKNEEELLEQMNQRAVQELLDKYAQGNIAKQEMEALSYYHTFHELEEEEYAKWLRKIDARNFFDLPEEPIIEWENGSARKFELFKIAGTAVGRDKQKHIVGLLTTEGFLKVKIYRSQFVKYDKQIKLDGVTEKSWFSKGNKLLLTGYRNGDYFIPKVYKSTGCQAIYKFDKPGKLISKRLGEGQ